LLIRRHLATGECAYHYGHIAAGQPVSFARLITAAGPALTGRGELEFGKDTSAYAWAVP